MFKWRLNLSQEFCKRLPRILFFTLSCSSLSLKVDFFSLKVMLKAYDLTSTSQPKVGLVVHPISALGITGTVNSSMDPK